MRGIPTPLALVAALSLAAGAADAPSTEHHGLRPALDAPLRGADESLRTATGQPYVAYRIVPERPRAGLVMVHEWWGLTEHIRHEADLLSEQGYEVLAVDLYDGEVTQRSERAARLMRSADTRETVAELAAALEDLGQRYDRVGVLGWCFGGVHALEVSLEHPELMDATVVYYGRLELDPERLARLRAPVQGVFATQDDWVDPDMVAAWERALIVAGREYEIHSFDARHAFANPSGDAYDDEASRAARRLTHAFLARLLLEPEDAP